jgi:phosphatidylserine decarboxylase
VDGKIKEIRRIEGTYFTVNPMAVRTVVDVYTENVRSITIMESAEFGKVVMVCVGAMLVGSIELTQKQGEFKR